MSAQARTHKGTVPDMPDASQLIDACACVSAGLSVSDALKDLVCRREGAGAMCPAGACWAVLHSQFTDEAALYKLAKAAIVCLRLAR